MASRGGVIQVSREGFAVTADVLVERLEAHEIEEAPEIFMWDVKTDQPVIEQRYVKEGHGSGPSRELQKSHRGGFLDSVSMWGWTEIFTTNFCLFILVFYRKGLGRISSWLPNSLPRLFS